MLLNRYVKDRCKVGDGHVLIFSGVGIIESLSSCFFPVNQTWKFNKNQKDNDSCTKLKLPLQKTALRDTVELYKTQRDIMDRFLPFSISCSRTCYHIFSWFLNNRWYKQLIIILLPNTDRLQQVVDYVRGCTTSN
jgi:hypothetical protein